MLAAEKLCRKIDEVKIIGEHQGSLFPPWVLIFSPKIPRRKYIFANERNMTI